MQFPVNKAGVGMRTRNAIRRTPYIVTYYVRLDRASKL